MLVTCTIFIIILYTLADLINPSRLISYLPRFSSLHQIIFALHNLYNKGLLLLLLLLYLIQILFRHDFFFFFFWYLIQFTSYYINQNATDEKMQIITLVFKNSYIRQITQYIILYETICKYHS